MYGKIINFGFSDNNCSNSVIAVTQKPWADQRKPQAQLQLAISDVFLKRGIQIANNYSCIMYHDNSTNYADNQVSTNVLIQINYSTQDAIFTFRIEFDMYVYGFKVLSYYMPVMQK